MSLASWFNKTGEYQPPCIVSHQAELLCLDDEYQYQFYYRGAGDCLWPVLLYPEKDGARKNRKTANHDRTQW